MTIERIERTGVNSLSMLPVIINDDRLSPVDRLLLMIIATFDRGPKGCYLSNAQLGWLAGCSPGTVSNSVNKMYDMGHIIVNRQSKYYGGRRYKRKVAPHVKNLPA